ncbi:unnamed protein product [Adineta steineri]|uniref:Multifunctional fusion protein n=1 Tax=Adineta steineri TaxID=433720 RepID=A0A819M6C5_9BILA|nr:unnamed protein product [Adineta steineri]
MDTITHNIEQRRRIVQDRLLIWLDESMNETNKDYKHILTQIQTGADNISVFIQRDECVDFLSDNEDFKSFLVIENTVAQQIIPFINDIPQIEGVYIFNRVELLHKEWTNNWQKIKSVHPNIDDVCKALQLDVKRYNQDSIAISFVTAKEITSTDDLNQLDPTFMYTQIFKDILLDMEHGKQAIKQFTAYCRHNDCVSLPNINHFEKEYHAQSAIWWYTFPSNIYSMLNYALRSMEGDIIINMGFLIHDLHQQIQQLHQQQINSYHGKPFIVYRGQGLSKTNFEKLQKTKGGLMSFNNFLSTSTEKDLPVGFALSALENTDTVGVLFEMFIDPCIKSTPFASIKEKSYFNKENEILFSMHTVFRVGAVNQIENNSQLYQVELQLTSDDDQQLRLLTDRIREEADCNTAWQKLGNLLLKIGQFNKAEGLYNVLLEQTSDEGEKAIYYHQLGYIKNEQDDYEKAIWYYEKALKIRQKSLSSNHPLLATSYNNIGCVYHDMGEYPTALSFYKKAHEVLQKTLLSNHPHLASSCNNIGSVYSSMGEYLKALSFYEQGLEIREKTLPSNHPSLAVSYNNMGSVYGSMGKYSEALSFYQKVLEIFQKSLPSNHPDLATSYNNIGHVYGKMGDYSKALTFYEKALEIFQKTFPLNHPYLATSYNNIGGVYESMEDYSKALSHFKKAFEIYQKTLSSNHPHLATSYNNIGDVYYKMKEYSKALSFYEKALEIRQKTLPSNHSDLAISYKNISNVYCKMKDRSKALSYYERALDILQRAIISNSS